MVLRIPASAPLTGVGPPAADRGSFADLYFEYNNTTPRTLRAIWGPKDTDGRVGWGDGQLINQVVSLISIEGVSNPGGNVDVVPQNSITVLGDDAANTVTIGETHSGRVDNPHGVTAAQAGAIPASEKGAAGGVAPLRLADTKIDTIYLPDTVLGGMDYQGTWDASANVPALGTIAKSKGDYWRVSVAGTTNLWGITDWAIGDWAVWNGTSFDKLDNTDQVTSVDGRRGAVDLSNRYAAIAHVGAGGGAHAAVVSGGAAGFISGADKAKLDGIPPGGSAGYTAQTHIEGLGLRWDSVNALTIESGSAYIPSKSGVLETPNAISKSSLAFTANTWYYVYLFDNAGAPDVEISTIAPATPYKGKARIKGGATPDNTRRYLGAVKSNGDATPRMWQFLRVGNQVKHVDARVRVLSAFASTTLATVSLGGASGLVPPTSRLAEVRLLNTGTDRSVFLSVSTTSELIREVALNSADIFLMPANVSLEVQIQYLTLPTSGAAYLDLYGYTEER